MLTVTIKKMLKFCGGHAFQQVLPYYLKSRRGISIILMYHRVVKQLPEGFHDPAMFVRADSFEMHIKEILRFFRIVPLQELLRNFGLENLCAITFDDGWDDTYSVAFPVLKKCAVPATVFVSGDLIGKNGCFWFENLMDLANKASDGNRASVFVQYFHRLIPVWRPDCFDSDTISDLILHLKTLPAETLSDAVINAYEELGLMLNKSKVAISWEEIKEMSDHSINFAPHGLNHLMLTTLNSKTKRREIHDSLSVLHDKGIDAIPVFSYPNGDWDIESVNYLVEEGYQGATTTNLGYNTDKTDPYLLNRIGLHESISNTPGMFWFRIFQAMQSGPQPWRKQ